MMGPQDTVFVALWNLANMHHAELQIVANRKGVWVRIGSEVYNANGEALVPMLVEALGYLSRQLGQPNVWKGAQ